MQRALAWMACALLVACGGATRSTPGDSDPGSGTSSGANTSTAGRAAQVGVEAASGTGAHAGGGGKAPDGTAGSGGKVPDFPGGSPSSALDCDAPYAGPLGGPRLDGPADLGGCEGIADDVVLARYRDRETRVPRGLYFDAQENIAFLSEPCSMSEQETIMRGPTDGMGTFVTSYGNEWFYEAVYCFDDSLRRLERDLRCDYFDGSKLAQPTADRLAFLGSVLWWTDFANIAGSVLLGHAVTTGDATDTVELCSISTAYGDFGLCDEVRLESTKHRLRVDGTVVLGTPSVVRTLKGDCH